MEKRITYDQPLFLIKDPEYMLHNHIEHIVARINEEIGRKKIMITQSSVE